MAAVSWKPRIPYRVSHFVRVRHQAYTLKRTMPRVLAACRAGRMPDPADLGRLVYGWGNASFSADTAYLERCLAAVEQGSGPVLECGSGLSTIVLAAAAEGRGRTLRALEHTPEWADRVQAELDRYGLAAGRVCRTPLVDQGEFDWYDVSQADLPAGITLVICDGPPMATRGGRFGLLPVVRSRLAEGCLILLDDAVRPEERAIAARWRDEFGGTLDHEARHKGIIAYTLPG